MFLSQLPNGSHALVEGLVSDSAEVGAATLHRLGELGFIAGEPVRLVWTSSRNALALALLGWTMFDREAAECGMDPKF